ncbi:copper resistance CopC family protein [Dyella flagellata]|uniref:Copper resistance protein n=1 Tax=Dyella flagellata TaxID=1867833 RepID=A0ABQ5XG92_9GAMM|nr:copper resistance CopC family protein [Dyella flagellata]GLQ89578.1 copper resistance protein [Dyella flagellata]
MSLRHRFGSFLIASACAFASMAASAHAILVDSSPKLNGTVTAGHVAMMFKYNSKIDQHRSRLVLIGPDKSETVLSIATGSKSNEIDTSVDLTPGAYTLRWQALALDGHITRGDLPFTVVAKQ